MLAIKVVLSLFLIFIAQKSFANREYYEDSYMQCSSSNITDSKKLVVFVNGIMNSLDAAEESRKKIRSEYIGRCSDCDFRKVYNQTDRFVDDTQELNLVGDWQNKSIDKAVILLFDKIVGDIYKISTNEVFKNKVLAYDGKEFPAVDIKKYLLEWVNIQRTLAAKGFSGSAIRYYNPTEDGTSIVKKLIKNNEAAISNSRTTFTDNPTYKTAALIIYQAYLEASSENIDSYFYTEYRSLLSSIYHSDRNLYKDDAAATGSMTKSVESLKAFLTEQVLSGKKVVVVAHSQGNHVIELAYSSLKQSRPQTFMDAIRVVGVASVSSSSPNNLYITWNEDHTVLDLHRFSLTKQFNEPLAANFIDDSPWYGFWDDVGSDHSFNSIYTSKKLMGKYTIPNNSDSIELFSNELKNSSASRAAVDVLLDMLDGSMASAKEIPPTINSTSPLTIQITWEDYRDMDLHVFEPNQKMVSYMSKIGSYGRLDLDDRDGAGPEHYYANKQISCGDLSEKTWQVYIHQYPNGGAKASVNLLFKIGDNYVFSRSFGFTNWPSYPFNVGYVKFYKYLPGNTALPFRVSITDPNGS